MVFSNTRAVLPATVGAHYFVGDELVQWDSITATAMFTALPGLIFFFNRSESHCQRINRRSL
jgi:ABC-type glycerol-3-phosphate transport system permease component